VVSVPFENKKEESKFLLQQVNNSYEHAVRRHTEENHT
jgi:hypothetical protein